MMNDFIDEFMPELFDADKISEDVCQNQRDE
jgi:hypothetical protein